MVATAPVPSAWTLANDSLSRGSVKRPLEPTQIAPGLLTAGSSAAASPPSMGSSPFGHATRLETITSRIGFSPVQATVVTFQRAEGSGTGAEVFALVAQADMQESANVQTFDARSFCPELRLPSRVVTAQGHEFSFFAEQRRVFSPDRAEPSFGM